MTQTATPPSTAPSERKNPLANLDWRRYVIYIGFAVVFLFFAITLGDDGFLTGNNLLNIVRQTATVTIIAVGMTYVIAAAQIDLSVGATAGLASVVTAMTIANYGVFLGILAGLAVGVVVGSVNGALVAMLKIPSFLVTLGMLGIAAGVAQWITKSAPQPILSDLYNKVFGSGDIGPIPGLIVWMIIVVVIGAIVLAKTRFGRQVLATGGNPIAAKFTGINTTSITFRVLLISALLAALAGMLYAGQLQSGRSQWGTGDELSAIAAVILGGTRLFVGSGTVVGTLFDPLLIGLINNGLSLDGRDTTQQQVGRRVIIILPGHLARRKYRPP